MHPKVKAIGIGVATGGGTLATLGSTGAFDRRSDVEDEVIEDESRSLSSNKDYTDNSKIGYIYGRFLLDPKANKDLWDTKISDIKKSESLSGKFKDVKDEKIKIQQACKSIYLSSESIFSGSDKTSEVSEEDFWKYCSFFSKKPFVVKDKSSSDYKGKWADQGKNKDYLIDAKTTDNDDVWQHIYEKVLKLDKDIKESKFTSANSGEDLKKVCEEAYKSTSISGGGDYAENIVSYCTISTNSNINNFPTQP